MERTKFPAQSKVQRTIQPLPVITNPEIQKGIYSNVALIHHTENEFLIDFLMRFGYEAHLVSRIILSPEHIKALSKAITENIAKFEAKKSEKKK